MHKPFGEIMAATWRKAARTTAGSIVRAPDSTCVANSCKRLCPSAVLRVTRCAHEAEARARDSMRQSGGRRVGEKKEGRDRWPRHGHARTLWCERSEGISKSGRCR